MAASLATTRTCDSGKDDSDVVAFRPSYTILSICVRKRQVALHAVIIVSYHVAAKKIYRGKKVGTYSHPQFGVSQSSILTIFSGRGSSGSTCSYSSSARASAVGFVPCSIT